MRRLATNKVSIEILCSVTYHKTSALTTLSYLTAFKAKNVFKTLLFWRWLCFVFYDFFLLYEVIAICDTFLFYNFIADTS